MTRPIVLALAAAAAVLVWFTLELLLMVFVGILLAIFLHTLAAWVSQVTGLRHGASLALVVLALAGGATLVAWLYAPALAEQSDQLAEALPRAFSDLTSWLRNYEWGRWMLDQLSSSADDADVVGQARTVASRVVGGSVAAIVVLFSGLYFAAEPAPYIRGVLRLVPQARRELAAELMFSIGGVLRWWLLGQALAMTLVGLAMGIGLWVIGVRLAFILGVLAGAFEFIPFLGPLLALGPALLLALVNSEAQAGYVLALYFGVQALEGYVLTPLVQRRAIELPPVLTIVAQVALGTAAGGIGLLVAVPVAAVVMVAVQTLYVEERLGDVINEDIRTQARAEVAGARTGLLAGVLP